MSSLTKFFFRTPYEVVPQTSWNVVQWWESRRMVYNVVVGAAGMLTLTCAAALSLLPPVSQQMPIPILPVIAYGVMANLFYTAGPIIDIIITKSWGRQYSAVGAALFRYGFAFAVGLTLLPIPVMVIVKTIQLLGVNWD